MLYPQHTFFLTRALSDYVEVSLFTVCKSAFSLLPEKISLRGGKAHWGFRGFGPQLLGPISVDLWQGRTSWRGCVVEQNCSPRGDRKLGGSWLKNIPIKDLLPPTRPRFHRLPRVHLSYESIGEVGTLRIPTPPKEPISESAALGTNPHTCAPGRYGEAKLQRSAKHSRPAGAVLCQLILYNTRIHRIMRILQKTRWQADTCPLEFSSQYEQSLLPFSIFATSFYFRRKLKFYIKTTVFK